MAKKNQQTTALAVYDEELAALAEQAAGQEANTGGGQTFSFKNGKLTLGDMHFENDEVPLIILDSVLENVYYTKGFDPDNLSSPDCYAFGRDEKTMAPHEEAEDPQSDACASCDWNKFGSAAVGRGKACRNRRRLACLIAGTFDAQGNFEAFGADELQRQPIVFANIPPTAITGFGTYVKSIAATHKLPPLGVVTHLKVEPDDKTMIAVSFSLVQPADRELFPTTKRRREEALPLLERAYPKNSEREQTAAPRRAAAPQRGGRGAAKAAAPTARGKAPARNSRF